MPITVNSVARSFCGCGGSAAARASAAESSRADPSFAGPEPRGLQGRGGSGDDWPQLRQPAQRGRVLATIRRRGWELVRRDEVVAIARPLGQGEQVVAAIGIALPLSRFRGEHRRQVLDGLAAAANEINEALRR